MGHRPLADQMGKAQHFQNNGEDIEAKHGQGGAQLGAREPGSGPGCLLSDKNEAFTVAGPVSSSAY